MGVRATNAAIRGATLTPRPQNLTPIMTDMVLPNHSGIESKDLPVPILLNPTTTTNIEGASIKIDYNQELQDNAQVRLIHINATNQDSDDVSRNTQLFPIRINVDTNATDTGAGLAVVNTGKSDNIYLAVTGKSPGTECAPTGIGIDMNKDDNSLHRGYGVQVWDFSTSSHASGKEPTCVYLKKHGSMNTTHKLIRLKGNRNSIYLEVDNTATSTDDLINIYNTDNSSNVFSISPTGAITSNTLTSGRVPIISTSGLITDDADLTFSTDTLTATYVKAGTNFKSSDGTAGLTSEISMTDGTLSVKNGLITAWTPA